ncbi:2-amino-4-hydroxy-6-hydroxymethyldihydropteridine diphosphokinase [Algoriphagus aestuarii]|nr:2-amino-4-hydroxy-6-hydroxymethyldihydropteridine diphosphokinase [Algoriphagus aestuarii]
MSKVTLLLGGNRGDRELLLSNAVKAVTKRYPLLFKSLVYETEAWGGIAKGPFLNQVIQIETKETPMVLLAFIQKIEAELGRMRNDHWGDRTMDIDILFWGDDVINTPELTIPHPFIQERKFVLEPLKEIMPDFIHPVLRKTIRVLDDECKDISSVQVYKK